MELGDGLFCYTYVEHEKTVHAARGARAGTTAAVRVRFLAFRPQPEGTSLTTTIHNALCACLGLPPTSDQALSLIRQAYTEPENSPQPARSVDVIYWSLSPEQGSDPATYGSELGGFPIAPQPPFGSGIQKPTVHRYLPYRLLIVCYGPSCEAYAHKIRSFLYLDGAGLPRQILRKAGIYPVPDPPAPLLLYEPEGSLWRRRADVAISLRVKDTLIYSVNRNAITSAPAVILQK